MSFTPSDVLKLSAPTNGFLCPLSANKYGIEFLSFSISNYETKCKLFEVGTDCPPEGMEMQVDEDDMDTGERGLDDDDNSCRRIKYTFSEDVLKLALVQTSLTFSVGDNPLRDLRMIERHYFRSRLVRNYDFSFGFVIPASTNTWDAVYDVANNTPALDQDLIEEMIRNPYETTSDTFYIVGDDLVMHNKASYRYVPEDRAQEKRSYELAYDYCKANGRMPPRGGSESDGLEVGAKRCAEEKAADSVDDVSDSKSKGVNGGYAARSKDSKF